MWSLFLCETVRKAHNFHKIIKTFASAEIILLQIETKTDKTFEFFDKTVEFRTLKK